jgi:hypothetical protein
MNNTPLVGRSQVKGAGDDKTTVEGEPFGSPSWASYVHLWRMLAAPISLVRCRPPSGAVVV